MKKLVIYFTVYLFMTIIFLDISISHFTTVFYKNEILKLNREATEVPFEMISEYLSQKEPKEMFAYIDSLKKKYNYPMELKHIDDINKYERSMLLEGNVVTDLNLDFIKKLVKGSDYVFIIGPFNDEDVPGLEFGSTVFFFVYILILNIFMAYFIWTQLMKLNRAAVAFGDGDFSGRIKYGKLSFISKISASFNNMADKIEKLIKSNRDLTNAVAHELRTPIARIKFELENLKMNSDSPSVGGIEQDIRELEELITELLTYSRLDREEDFLNRSDVDVYEWFSSYFSSVRPISERDFSWSVTDSCKGVELKLDKKLMVMTVNNLLVNAFKYSKESVAAEVSLGNKSLKISVSDDGDGIDEDILEEIFKPFRRTDGSRSKETGGFGLGLAVVRRIVELHGGEVSARNSEKAGAVFDITLPTV